MKCKNDPSRSYKGTEPSPKGLGYCAHAEKVGTIKFGKDDRIWIIEKTKNGVKRWVLNEVTGNGIECNKIVTYHVRNPNGFGNHILRGLQFEPGYLYEWKDYNSFSNTLKKIPKDAKKQITSNQFIKKYFCDPNRKKLKSSNKIYNKISHPRAKKYFIHDNGDKPFLVYIMKNSAHIYRQPDENSKYFVSSRDYKKEWAFIQKVTSYKTLDTFIGKSPKNSTTDFSGGHGKQFDGNSILLRIGKERYVSIGCDIYEFSTPGDKILEYWSSVGNNDVPQPVAIGEKNTYFMRDLKYVKNEKFDKHPIDMPIKIRSDLYYIYYYGGESDVKYSKYSYKIKQSKIIQKRI